MKDGREFVGYWAINAIILYFLPLVINNLMVSGNERLTPFMASLISSFLLTTFVAVVHPAFLSLKVKFKDDWQWTMAYLFVNVLGVWLLARYADLTGLGIANAWVAVFLGILITLCQWSLRKLAFSDKK